MSTTAADSSVSSEITTAPAHSSASSSFLALQQAALKELPRFNGEPEQKVTHFVDTVEHIGTFTNWNDAALHTLATIKLGGIAFNWYTNNKDDLTTWPLLKSHLLERFQPSVSLTKTKLKNRRQHPNEPLSTFYDDILELCKQVDRQMPMYMIVDYLVDGVRDDLRIHVKRLMANTTETLNAAFFLKIARAEDELQKEISSVQPPSSFSQPYFGPVAAATYRAHPSQHTTIDHPTTSTYRKHSSRSAQTYRPCLICNRSTHRTIDCSRKQPSGCFKCGDPEHVVHNCPQVFQ